MVGFCFISLGQLSTTYLPIAEKQKEKKLLLSNNFTSGILNLLLGNGNETMKKI